MATTTTTSHPARPKLIVVAPTFYSSLQDTRYLLGVKACREAAKYRIDLILIDASPLQEDVMTGLEKAGTAVGGHQYVHVHPQKSKGKKGVALREGIAIANQQLQERFSSLPDKQNFVGIIALQELEKVDMFRHWQSVVDHMMDATSPADVTLVRRLDSSFQTFYPIEQYYAETFGNLYLDSLGATIALPSLDWTSGPLAFRTTCSQHWLDCQGEIWDAQLVPVIHAFKAGARVSSCQVDYRHPEAMKQQEEGDAEWNEKRLMQLNFLKDTVGQAIKDTAKEQSK